jgi:MFS family permease
MFIFVTMLVTPKVVSRWFKKTKGRMMGLIAAGNNACGLSVVQMATAVERLHGWRWTARVFGFNVTVVALLFFLFVRDYPLGPTDDAAPTGAAAPPPPSEAPVDTTDASPTVPQPAARKQIKLRDAMRSAVYWRTMLGCVCSYWIYSSCLSQLYVHFEAEGFSDQAAASAVSAVAFCGILSKLVFGRASETITARWALGRPRNMSFVMKTFHVASVVNTLRILKNLKPSHIPPVINTSRSIRYNTPLAYHPLYKSHILFVIVCCLSLAIVSCTLFIISGTALNWVGAVIFGLGFGGIGAVLPLVVMEQYGSDNYGTIMGSMQVPPPPPLPPPPLISSSPFPSRL